MFTLPENTRVYAVGDIHGCFAHLTKLLAEIEADASTFAGEKYLVFLGDYVDRGLNSQDVIETVRQPREGWDVCPLMGNHDKNLHDFLQGVENDRIKGWLFMHGGQATLASYGVLARPTQQLSEIRQSLLEVFPQEHIDFLENLSLYSIFGDYMFVHAGVRPHIPLEAQEEGDLIYLRPPEFERHGLPYRVVFGHTILPEPLVEADRIGVDTGAYTGGALTCAVLEGTAVRFLHARV